MCKEVDFVRIVSYSRQSPLDCTKIWRDLSAIRERCNLPVYSNGETIIVEAVRR
jgi:hypothetical protein